MLRFHYLYFKMKFTNLVSMATLAYAGSVAAYGYDSVKPVDAQPQENESTSPSSGGSASPQDGTTTAPSAGDSDFQPAVNCRNDICYSAVVPATTARSRSGPVWFQIYAPTTFSWVAMGTGSSMADSNMFIVYQDGNGNVTLSHRQASGRTMPQVPTDTDVTTTLLAGSGVRNGFMIANFRCDNCTTWKSSQTLDFTSTGTSMIGAWQQGDSLDSTDVDESIGKHTGSPRAFSFDLSAAQKSSAGNPFIGAFAVPEEVANGGANNTDEDDGDDDDEGAAAGRSGLLSGSVAIAAVLTAMSLVL